MPPPARPSVGPPTPGAAATAPVATPEPLPAQPSSVHELRTLVLSRHPLVVIETAEEERLDTVLAGVARDLHLAVFDWAVTRGLSRLPEGSPVYGTEDPARLFAQIAELEVNGLFVLKDAAAHLTAPTVARSFRELLARFASPGTLSTVILVGASVALSEELDALAVRYDLALPSAAEYRAAIAAVAESLAANGQATVELDGDDTDALAGALGGLTINQARQAVARVAIEDGRLQRADLSRLTALKAEALRDDGPLEFFPSADNTAELGGFAGLERWLDRARIGFSAEAAALNLTAPRGILLVGVQGCGKIAGRQGDRPPLGAAPAQARRGTPLRQVRRRDGEEPPARDCDRRVDGARSCCGSTRSRRRSPPSGGGSDDGGAVAPCVRHVPHVAAGEAAARLRRRHGQRHLQLAAGAAAQGPLRRDLLRRPARRRRARGDPRASTSRCGGRTPRRFDLPALVAASDGFSGAEIEQVVITALLQSLQEQRPLDTAMLTAEVAATVPLSVSRADDVARLREFAHERFVPVR